MNLICYLSNGYPTIEKSIEVAQTYVSAGCDMIEIDFPSRDPFLEGEFIGIIDDYVERKYAAITG